VKTYFFTASANVLISSSDHTVLCSVPAIPSSDETPFSS
jgi:hypothetical protein